MQISIYNKFLLLLRYEKENDGRIKDVQTYEQSTRLNGYVMDLQKFDALLKKEMLRRTITIEGRELTGIEDKVFKI